MANNRKLAENLSLDTPPSLEPEFYRDKIIIFDRPDRGLKLLRKLPPSCLTAIKTIRVCVHAVYNPGPEGHWWSGAPADGPQWVALLEYLVGEATGLRELEVIVDADRSFNHWGGGYDPQLLHALGKFRTLDTFKLKGFFARQWPSYLQAATGCEVWNAAGQTDWYLKELAKYQSDVEPVFNKRMSNAST